MKAAAMLLQALALVPATWQPAAAKATAPGMVQSQYARSLWRTRDGLPEDTVQSIVESREGMLWIGTTGGLAKFDGSRMQVPKNVQSLLANSIFTLTLGRDGSLWVGTEGSGLLHVQRTGIAAYSVRDGLTDGFVRKLLTDSKGRLWVGTDDGLFLMDTASGNERLRRVDQGTIAPIAVHAITEDHSGTIWVGGSRLIALHPNGEEQEFALQGAYSQTRVKTLLETRDHRLWVGTVGGLQYFDGFRFHVVKGIRATVRTLLQSQDGRLWIGTIGDGLWTLESRERAAEMTGQTHVDRLVQMSMQGLLPSDTVLAVFEDGQRQIWIGTQSGLVRLNRTPVRIVSLPEGGDADFETISGDQQGDVWVAAQRLYLIRNGIAKPVIYGGLKNVTVRNVFRARDGALWIGTDGSGAYQIKGTRVRHYTAPAELTNNFVRGFLQTRDGAIWIAADEGVSRITGSGSEKLTEANGLVFFSTRSLLQDGDGNVWIGTDHGLSKWKDGHFESDAITSALADEKVWSILQDRTGALWFGTRNHGLFRYDPRSTTGVRSIRTLTVQQGLPSNSINQILQDKSGTFWVTGPNTISSIAEAEMESNPSDDRPLSVQTYEMPYQSDGAQIYGGRQPAGFVATDGSVWFPTSRGAAHISEAVSVTSTAPQARVDQVVEDGRTILPETERSNLKIAANVVRLSFAFTAISLQPQNGVRFRYKLEGFDPGWTAAGAARVATYTNLPAGQYRFRVQAFDTANPKSISEFDLGLIKAQVFYETGWFYAACAALLAGVVWAIYLVRVRVLRRRFAAVLDERSRLAREMHDTVIQGCTGISALLEAMASRVGEQVAKTDSLLECSRLQARKTIDEARQAIWNMRHEHEGNVDLIAALNGVAAQISRDSGELHAVVVFEHDVGSLQIGASMAHEILMTVREAVYNAVQHSGSSHVEIRLSVRGADVTVCVEDHGCGFEIELVGAHADGHYGILGMRERVQRLGGQMDLTSVHGSGTRLQLRLRVGHLS